MLGETIGTISVSASGYLITHSRTVQEVSGPLTIVANLHTTIFHIHLISNGSGASVLTVSDGQGGVQKINITGVTSKGTDFDFGIWGIDFTSGAYITVDGNIQAASVVCKANDF